MIWDLKTRAQAHSLTVTHPKTKAALAFRFCRFVKPAAKDASSPPPPEVLVTCANSGSRGASALQVWSIAPVSGSGSAGGGGATFKLIANVALDQAPICALQLSHDHSLLACASNRSNIFVFDTRTWRQVHSHPSAHDLPVTGLAFSPDSCQLLSVSADRSSKIFATRRPPMGCGALLLRVLLLVLVLLLALALLGFAPAVREVLVGIYVVIRVAVFKLALASGF